MISNVVAAARRFGVEAATWSRRRMLDNGLTTARSGLADASTPIAFCPADFTDGSGWASGCCSGAGSDGSSIVVAATGPCGASCGADAGGVCSDTGDAFGTGNPEPATASASGVSGAV
jgi:hypothetical protein